MKKLLNKIISLLPIVLLSLVLAFFVWFSAVNSKDPTEEITYNKPIPIEILGQNPQYTITEQSVSNVTVTIKAPRSVHNALANDMKLIRATVNISVLQDGYAELEPEFLIGIKPAKLVDFNPKTVNLTIEKLITKTFDIVINQIGNLSTGLEARPARLDVREVQVTGPESRVSKITELLATVDMSTIIGSLNKQVDLIAVDEQGNIVDGVTINPSRVTVNIPVLQRGGYKNVFLALVPLGSPAYGYQITKTEIIPPMVTVYTNSLSQIDSVPDLIETTPVNLNGRDKSFEQVVTLNLPAGVNLASDIEIIVKITIEPTITTKTIRGIPITLMNTPEGFDVMLNITTVDVYLTGPTHLLAELTAQNLTVEIDLSDFKAGTHQVNPAVILPAASINYLIVPDTVEVRLQPR
ncbi:MAG TPA: CdaR family protein [Anaerolineaceae bacterium]|nr:CdaR family protein [Anaerolineaceae bacterium]